MDLNPKAVLSVFFLLWSSLCSAEREPLFWSRETLSDGGWSCGSVIRPTGGPTPEVFHFRFNESPSKSLWRDGNEVAPAERVRGECAVAVVAPTLSSRLSLRVDSISVAGGAQQCLAANALSLYDLGGGRLLLKDTICGWEKKGVAMQTTGNLALITINIQKGSFVLTVMALTGGIQHTTTPGAFPAPLTTIKPAQFQEHVNGGHQIFTTSDVFLVPLTTLKHPFQGEATNGKPTPAVTMPPTTTEDSSTSAAEETSPQGSAELQEIQQTTITTPVENGTTENRNPLFESQSGAPTIERTTTPPETSTLATTTNPPRRPGGSGIQFIIPSGSAANLRSEEPTRFDKQSVTPPISFGDITTLRPESNSATDSKGTSETTVAEGVWNGGSMYGGNTAVTAMSSRASTMTYPSRSPPGSGIQFVFPRGPSAALLSENNLQFTSQYSTLPTTTEDFIDERRKLNAISTNSTERPPGSGTVFVFDEDPAETKRIEDLVHSTVRTETPKLEEDSTTMRVESSPSMILKETSRSTAGGGDGDEESINGIKTAVPSSTTSRIVAVAGVQLVSPVRPVAAHLSEEPAQSTLWTVTPSTSVESFATRRTTSGAPTNFRVTAKTINGGEGGNIGNAVGRNDSVASQTSAELRATNPTSPSGSGIVFVIPKVSAAALDSKDPPHLTLKSVTPMVSADDFTTTSEETSVTTVGEKYPSAGDIYTGNITLPPHNSTTTTSAPKRNLWSGIHFVIPKESVSLIRNKQSVHLDLRSAYAATSVDDLSSVQPESSTFTVADGTSQANGFEGDTEQWSANSENTTTPPETSLPTITVDVPRNSTEVFPSKIVNTIRDEDPVQLELRSETTSTSAEDLTNPWSELYALTTFESRETSVSPDGDEGKSEGSPYRGDVILFPLSSATATEGNATAPTVVLPIEFAVEKRRILPVHEELRSATNPVSAPDLPTTNAVDLSTYKTDKYEDFQTTTRFEKGWNENSDTSTESVSTEEYSTLSTIVLNGDMAKFGRK